MTEPSPEYDAVRLAAAASFGDAEAAEMAALLSADLDWEKLYAEAVHHRLQARLYTRMQQCGATESEDYRRLLRTLQRSVPAQVALSLFLTSEMAHLARALDAAALPYLVLKGPTLAEAYGGIGTRPFVDNDLLIRRSDFDRADAVFVAAGFQRRNKPPGRLAGYLYIHGEVTYGRQVASQISTLDVHTALVPPGLSYGETFEALHRRARPLPVGGAEVPALSWEDLLTALAVNGLKDHWSRLRLVSDVAAVVPFVSDWTALLDRAKKAGALRSIHLGLLLAAYEARAALPPEVLRRAEADKQAVALARWMGAYLRALTTDGLMDLRARARLTLRVQDGLKGQLKYGAFVLLRRVTERYVDPSE